MNRKKRVIAQVSETREEIREKKGLTSISKKKKQNKTNCKNQEKKTTKRATSTINDHDNEVVRSFNYLGTVMMVLKKSTYNSSC